MTHEELLQAAHDAQPEMMKKVAAMMYLAEQLDPELAAQSAQEVAAIVERSANGLEKVSKALSPLAQVGIVAGGSILASLGTAMSSDLYDAARRGLTSSRNFNNILKNNPALLENHDKSTLRKSFDSLHRYGPEFTADPIVGGAYLGVLAADPSHSIAAMKDFTSARKNLMETKRKQFEPKLQDIGHTFIEAHKNIEDQKEDFLKDTRREMFQRGMADTEHGRRLRQELRRTAEERGKETRQQKFQRGMEAQKTRIHMGLEKKKTREAQRFAGSQQSNMFVHQYELEDYKQKVREEAAERRAAAEANKPKT